MSELEVLIQQLCPDGVSMVELGTFAKAEVQKNKSCTCNRAYSITQKGLIPTSEYFKEAKVTSEDTSGYKIVKKHWFVYSPSRIDVGSINYLQDEEDVIVSPLNVVFSVNENVIDVKYLLTFLNSRKGTWQILSKREGIEGTGRKMLPFAKFATIEVPIPPIQVQQEIVRILDQFTGLTTQLTAELTARKKQYEYYRDQLLTFESDIPMKALGDVCNVIAGGTPSKKNSDYWTGGTIKWLGSTVCKNQKTVDEITDYITEKAVAESSAKIMNEETTLVALVGATIGKVAFLPFKAAINQNIAGIYPKDVEVLIPSYVYYACTTLYSKFLALTQGTKLAMANMSFVRALEIPVPPIEEQRRIVSILDRFDTLCNDLTSGLPAEIEARRKQYEYYRDKLLTFKKKASDSFRGE